MAQNVTAQVAPLPPILGEPNAFPPRIGGQGGTPGAIETILTAWLSSYLLPRITRIHTKKIRENS